MYNQYRLIKSLAGIVFVFCMSTSLRSDELITLAGGACGIKFADSFFEVSTYQPLRTRRELCWQVSTGSTIIAIKIPRDKAGLNYSVEIVNETNLGAVEYASASRIYKNGAITVDHNFVTTGKFTLVLTGEGNQNHYVARHSLTVFQD